MAAMTAAAIAAGTRLTCHAVGAAFVVAAEGTRTDDIDTFARQLAGDPDHVVVVAGPGAEDPAASWTDAETMLAGLDRSVRLVATGLATDRLSRAGQRLADTLGREVLAQDGQAIRASGGALFVPPAAGNGWVRLRPGLAPLPGSRRFPTPWWAAFPLSWPAAAVLSRPVSLSATAVAEPLPGGVWLRSPQQDARLPELRHRLFSRLARPDEAILVVLDYPGGPQLEAGDLAAFYELLPARIRPWVRLVAFRPPEPRDREPSDVLGQVLADLLGHEVVMYAGLPVSDWQPGNEVRTRVVRGDGSLGWRLFASELAYQPRRSAPVVASHRPPVAGRKQTGPASYALAGDAVLEVTQSGLWLRTEPAPPGGSVIRCRRADPDHPVIVFSPPALRPLADEVRAAIDADLRDACLIRPADQGEEAAARETELEPGAPPVQVAQVAPVAAVAPVTVTPPRAAAIPAIQLESAPLSGIGQPAALPALEGLPGLPGLTGPTGSAPDHADPDRPGSVPASRPKVTAEPARPSAAVVQPVPEPSACVVPGAQSLERERAWLRHTMSQEYDAASSWVMRLLSEVPGLRGPTRASELEALSDLVAARLYLTGQGDGLDDAVRAARPGPHVPFARCVASGLRRMPSYRGIARLAVSLTDEQWRWYGSRHLVTEWACCAAVADAQSRLPGGVDFWIWSMTARRVHMLAPAMAAQVIFLPGTSFKVLSVRSGERREVLLRELLASEIGADGQVAIAPAPLDEVAMKGLDRAVSALREHPPNADLPPGYERRFASAPGLLAPWPAAAREREGGGAA
jgi:hypothetical protein